MTAVSPDARLPGLHAEAGDPHTRLAHALAALEGADWGLLVANEAALARQLAAQFGPGTLRVDARVPLSREVFASAGLALATVDADWRGARAVWLLEPDDRAFKRAQRAGVPVLVDATLAPGGGWLSREAALIVYRDGATLSGFGDVSLAAAFGSGTAPDRAAPAPSDLSLAMALRDLATLPLRLARAARTTATLMERFAGAAQEVGPTALLLAPDSASDTHQPVGGVLAAARNVAAGTLLTPGVQGLDAVLALLRGEEKAERTSAPVTPQAQASPLSPPAPLPSSPASSAPAASLPDVAAPYPSNSAPAEPLSYVPEIVFSNSVSNSSPPPEASAASTEPEPEPEASDPTPQDPATQQAHSGQPQSGNRPYPQRGRRPDRRLHRETSRTASGSSPDEGASEGHAAETSPSAAPQPDAESSGSPEREPRLEEAAQTQPLPVEAPQPEVALVPDLPPSAGAADPAEGLSDEQRATYARLRDWRNAEAKRQEISRFIIASNATLAEIARSAPSDEAQLRKVRGMGPERIRKYGAAILGTVQAD